MPAEGVQQEQADLTFQERQWCNLLAWDTSTKSQSVSAPAASVSIIPASSSAHAHVCQGVQSSTIESRALAAGAGAGSRLWVSMGSVTDMSGKSLI